MPRALIPCVLAALMASPLSAQEFPEDILLPSTGSGGLLSNTDVARDVLLGDLDGDGDLDAVVANLGADNGLWFNDGNFAFTLDSADPISNDGGQTMSGAIGDIDGDGDLDVMLVNRSNVEPNWLYINQGGAQAGTQGSFVRATTGDIATDIANSRNATFADVDGDGDLDVYVANLSNQANFLYINQGGAQLGTEGTFARNGGDESETAGGVSHGAIFGDIDDDGDLDLFVPNGGGLITPGGAVNFLFTNDGSGQFTRVLTGDAATMVANTKVAMFGDWENDGDLDLFLGNDTAQENRILLNDGNGAFTNTADRLDAPLRNTNDGAVVDFDEDGDLDIVIANLGGDDNEVYLNNGNGRFAVQSLGPIVGSGGDSAGVAVGPLDADGDSDVIFVNQGSGAFLYRNDGPQWSNLENSLEGTSGAPQLVTLGNLVGGEQITIRVTQGLPGATTALVMGFSTVFAPLKGGVLVPSPDFVLFGIPLNGLGSAGVSANMPVGAPPMFQVNFQWWVNDPGAPNGFAATVGARALTP